MQLWFRVKSISRSSLGIPTQIGWWIHVSKIKNRSVITTTKIKIAQTALTSGEGSSNLKVGLVSNYVYSVYWFYQYLCNINIDQNMLVSYATLNCCIEQQKMHHSSWILWKFLKITVSWNCGWKLYICIICVSFDNITLWHVYLFPYKMFNCRDGIRYSYVSFCAKSASISLVGSSVDIVASKNIFR